MIRDVLDDMKTRLEADLPGKLETQDEFYDEPEFFVSKEVVTVYVGDRDISNMQQLPACVLIPLDASIGEAITNKKDLFHNLALVVLAVGNGPEEGYKKAWTILRACENVFESLLQFDSIGQYQTQSYSYTEVGGVQDGKGNTVYTAALQSTIRERVDAYSSTQV